MHSRDPGFARPLAVLVISLFTLSCGGDSGPSGPTPNPTPTITASARDTATAGTTPFSVVLGGTDFMVGAVASFDGNARATNRLSSGAIAFALQTSDLAVTGDHEIRAKNPEPGGGPSTPFIFHVLVPPPVPVLDSLSPDTIVANSVGTLDLKAFGHGFVPGAVLRMNGGTVTTVRMSDTLLQTTIVGGILGTPGSVTMTVFKQGPGGGTSAGKAFTIIPQPPAPVITGTTPDSVVVGPGGIPFLIRGTAFAGADSVHYFYQGAGTMLAPTTVTDTAVSFTLDRTGLASLGVLSFTVHTVKGWSNPRLVELYNPTPVITGISPDTIDGAATVDTFFVIGTGFVPGMVVRVNGLTVQVSTVIAYDTIRAIVTEGALLLGGTPPVTVFDTWDGRTSAPQPIGIQSPVPIVDSISPASTLAGVAGSYTLHGTNFRALGEVLVNGVPHSLSYYYSLNSVIFHVDSADIAVGGAYSIAFRTPSPGGGTSDSVTLQVVTPNPVPVVDSVVPNALRSDSGIQTATLYGRQLKAGTAVVIRLGSYEGDPMDTVPALYGDSTSVTAEIPVSLLQAGRQLYVGLVAPAPTVRPSGLTFLPVWTTGVRKVTDVAGLPTYSFASDSARDLMYDVAVDVVDPSNPTTLVARDPTTGAVLKSLGLPDGGARLFYGGGKYLYATCAYQLKVCRIDLDTWTLDWSIPAFTVNSDPTAVVFIAPQDAHPGTFVLGVNQTGNEFANWVRVYDSTMPRASLDTFYSGVHFGRFFGDTLVTMNIWNVYDRSVTPGAESPLDSVVLASPLGAVAQILSRSRAVSGGYLVDLTTGTELGFHPGLTGLAATGPIAGRFYTAVSTDAVPTLELHSFDLNTGVELRHVGLHGAYPNAFGITPAGLPFLGYSTGIRIVESVATDP